MGIEVKMSLLAELKSKKGSTHAKCRVGRGHSSGWGGTAGKGHKGQKARAGAPIRRGFEGGQTPLQIRLPKFGFTNRRFKKTYEIVNLEQLEKLDGEIAEITPEVLKDKGLIHHTTAVKILGRGEITKPFNIKAHKWSQGAQKAIEGCGWKSRGYLIGDS